MGLGKFFCTRFNYSNDKLLWIIFRDEGFITRYMLANSPIQAFITTPSNPQQGGGIRAAQRLKEIL